MRRKLFVKVLAVLMAGTMLIGCGANAGDSSQSSENLVENSTELSSQPSEEDFANISTYFEIIVNILTYFLPVFLFKDFI